jgi:hypothetical protein
MAAVPEFDQDSQTLAWGDSAASKRASTRSGHDAPFQPKADHSTYLHENKAKTTKALFPVSYT